MHAIDGVRMALRDHAKYHDIINELKPLTQAMYALLDEAIRHCGLNEAETLVLENRYISPIDPVNQVVGCSEAIGMPERTVKYYSATALDKIHDYMNERGEAHYAQYDIRL